MPTTLTSPNVPMGEKILSYYKTLTAIPGGRFLFNRFLAFHIPYSATINARVMDLKPGYARFELADRRKVRNHLNSIHAIALSNFGELTSGLALMTGLPAQVRGIVLQITTNYLKKARGTLIAECHCVLPEVKGDTDVTVEAYIKDHEMNVVAQVKVLWRLGLKPTAA